MTKKGHTRRHSPRVLPALTLFLEDCRVHPGYHLASVGFAEMGIALHHFVPHGSRSLLRPLENGIVSQEQRIGTRHISVQPRCNDGEKAQ
jgi:hypothetical protein